MSTELKIQFFRFALTGVAGFIVDASILWLLTHQGIGPIIAQCGGFSVAVTVTWWLNRRYTFALHARPNLLIELVHYVIANSFGSAVNNGVFLLLILTVAPIGKIPILAVAAGSLAGLIFNFTSSRLWVFRSR